MPLHTILGWLEVARRTTHDQIEAAGAIAAITERARWDKVGDWRFIAAFEDRVRLAATIGQVNPVTLDRPRRFDATPMIYTTVGVWHHSGEAWVVALEAADGIEALALAMHRARLAGIRPGALQLVAALAGAHVAGITRETLPGQLQPLGPPAPERLRAEDAERERAEIAERERAEIAERERAEIAERPRLRAAIAARRAGQGAR